MHGSPWEYDTHIPLVFYGRRFVRPMTSNEPASQQDIVPTLAALLGTTPPKTASGRVLPQVVKAGAGRPKVIAVFVIDGGRADYLTRYASVMRTLSRLRAEGASFENAHVSSAPTATAVGHASIGTGAEPGTHGLAVNHVYNPFTRKEQEAYKDFDPGELRFLTLADVWNAETNGKAVIIGQGGAMRATIGLVGHGGCLTNANRVIAASYALDGGWETNSKCFVKSEVLAGFNAQKYWTTEQAKWKGRTITRASEFKPTALFARFEGEALAAVLEHEAIGTDEVTDLVLVNLKATDYVGHAYGPESEEIQETLQETDAQVGQALRILEQKAGEDGLVVVVTADHGMPGGPNRHFAHELSTAINSQFGEGTVLMLLDGANGQVHIDPTVLVKGGHTLDDVAKFLERESDGVGYIKYAFTENEVQSAQARLAR